MPTVEFKLGGTLIFVADESPLTAMVTLRYQGFTVTAKGENMAYTLPDGSAVKVRISYVDAQGNPASIDGDVTWSSSDASIATVQADADDTTNAIVMASGTLGQVQIVARADADLGSGVRELITTMDVEIVAGEAVAGTIEPVGPAEPMQPTQHA
jgi:hypothetical protein